MKKGGRNMENTATGQEKKEKAGISWAGVIVGLIVGAGLFLLTIQIVKALMYSLTAA